MGQDLRARPAAYAIFGAMTPCEDRVPTSLGGTQHDRTSYDQLTGRAAHKLRGELSGSTLQAGLAFCWTA